MEYANKVQKGTIFERCDRNGKVWYATVTERTPYFVYVSIKNPYDGSVEDYGERVQIRQKEVVVPLRHYNFILGRDVDSTTTEFVDDYFIVVHRNIRNRMVDMVFDLI